MSLDKGLKHNPFSSLRGAVRTVDATAPKPTPAPAAAAPLGRVVVREELAAAGAVLTRVIGVPPERRAPLGKRWRDELGHEVLIEGRDLLVMTDDVERIAAVLRDAGASEVKLVRREVLPDLSRAGEPGGTRRSQIRRGLRVAIVQKADQETGALTEGVVRDILTSSPEHPRGIKVRLESGEVGRVRRILSC
ncbi:Hypothetical protein A7982_05755 [Minicystis rosea]|nr:Hypothetical protein A7982_05755 [Minicystis rosea]